MLKTNKRGGNTTHKIFNILFKFHPCNIYKLKILKRELSCVFPNCWGSSKIWLMEVVKTWEKFQKVYKRKPIQNCSPKFEFKYFKTLQTLKQKWWGMLTCYYKPPLIIWQALFEDNKMPLNIENIKNVNNARNWKLKQVTSENSLQMGSKIYQGLLMINEGLIKVFNKFELLKALN